MDLRLQGSDAVGNLSFGGTSMQVMATGGTSYLRAPAALWTAEGVPRQTALRLDDNWVIPPPSQSGQLGLTSASGSRPTPSRGSRSSSSR